MRIAQVIPCLGRDSGGPSRSVFELSKGLRSLGVETDILTNNYLDNPNIVSESWIHSVDIRRVFPFEYNTKFTSVLKSRDYELFHIHSIYSYPVTVAAKYAREQKIPYIIAPRGSLYDSAIGSSSSLRKKIFNRLILYSDLNHACVIHATCQEEMEQIRKLGIKTPVAVIPNSVEIPQQRPLISTPNKFRLCFLGRINPMKNLDGLLKAWHFAGMSCRSDAELVIIGDAKLEKEHVYLNEIHLLERELGITNIDWKGNLQGSEKNDVLNSASFLILPSHSENFGMVVVEALIQGVPVVASKGTPWQLLETEGCGWWVNNSMEVLGRQILELKTVSARERMEMGHRGQEMVEKYFSSEVVCQSMKSLYNWVLNGGEKPLTVYM